MKRYIVDNLKMQNRELVCKEKTGRYKPVFKKQGCLDGACATYSVIMNLLILGVIAEKDTHIDTKYKTRETKKLFKVFCNDYGMHRHGQTYFKIKKMLDESFSSLVTTTHKLTSDKESVAIVKKIIDKAYKTAEYILSQNIDKLHTVAGILLEKEKIDGEEFSAIFEG